MTYKIVNNNSNIDICLNDRQILKGLIPSVKLYDGSVLNMELIEVNAEVNEGCGEKGSCTIKYADTEKLCELALKLDHSGEYLLCSVNAALKKEVFGKNRTFSGEEGITLSISGLGDCEGYMANYMHSIYWSRPAFGKEIGNIPEKTQSLLWGDGNVFHQLLPVCGEVFKSDIYGGDGSLKIKLASTDEGYSKCKTLCFVLGSSNNPFELAQKTAASGLNALNIPGGGREQRKYPETLEYLGWCSWDAFYEEVTGEGLLKKAAELKALKLPFNWFIVDCGWSEEKDKELMSFGAKKDKFPKGLGHVVEKLKNDYGIKKVGAWHAFTGFWDGIHPEGELASKYRDNILETKEGRLLPYPDGEKGFGFWNAWHKSLKSEGIDFVKVDNQSSLINFTRNNIAVGKAARGAHEALEASVGINFEGMVINCMGMASESIWSRPMSPISRNSDDFYPNSENNFIEHALQNGYNAFYHSSFIWCDYDMWWTVHDMAVNHAVLRAVSGGPVYVSDPLEKTDGSILWPLVLQDGKILRCDQNALPTKDCLLVNPREEKQPLKLWNKCGTAGILAAFNINDQKNEVVGNISPSDIPGLEGEEFIIYDYFHGNIMRAALKEKIEISLKEKDVSLYSIVPVTKGFAFVGLTNKYVSPAALEHFEVNGNKALILLKEGGSFGFYSEEAPSRITVDGENYDKELAAGFNVIECSSEGKAVTVEIIK